MKRKKLKILLFIAECIQIVIILFLFYISFFKTTWDCYLKFYKTRNVFR